MPCSRVTERNGAHAHFERFNTVPVHNCPITPHGAFKMHCCRRRVRSDMPELCGACEGSQRFNWQLRSEQADALIVDMLSCCCISPAEGGGAVAAADMMAVAWWS